MNKKASIFIVFTALLLGHGEIVHGNSIRFSKHDLSSSGGQTIKASGLDQVCIFCHTPHNARQDIPYLWNRSDHTTASYYIPYTSSTMKAPEGHIGSMAQPTGASKLCLSCHDGTIALGAIQFSESSPIPFSGATSLFGRSTSLGTDLSDDHPISFLYQGSIPTPDDHQLVDPATIAFESTSKVKLDSTDQLQCTACHDPHDNANGKFLVMDNTGSALCITCHTKSGWPDSSHATSPAVWNGTGVNPLPDASTSVAVNACGNCHRPHTAGRNQRLLKQFNEEDNCLTCHNGNVATKNIDAELVKTYKHPVSLYTGDHDAAENYSGVVINHVECVDCHNPHQVNSTTTSAPLVSGRLQGVPGVDFYTNAYLSPATNEYEICFKCHGDLSNNVLTTPPPITRYWTNTRDNRVKFNPANVSYHPVLAPLNKISDGMLNPPWVKGSRVYCTDCHGSDSSSVQGPHGSIYPHILVKKYDTSDVLPTSPTAYLTDNALCFKCHNSATLIAPSTKFPQHNKHLTDSHMERCTYCHDPHGNPTNSGMINFDMRPGIVTLSGGKPITLNYPLSGKMTCVLTCHGVVHGS